MNESKWESVDLAIGAATERLKVEGGYLYHVTCHQINQTSMCFVPDIDLARYQSHLRDAYRKGFEDGVAETAARIGVRNEDV